MDLMIWLNFKVLSLISRVAFGLWIYQRFAFYNHRYENYYTDDIIIDDDNDNSVVCSSGAQ